MSTAGRLLEVLSLLQARPRWSGPELADRLGVTVRTIRRDVDHLRQLGYPIDATAGVDGGYALGAGGRAVPPLMLDRDEAVAVAVCLRSTATELVEGGDEAALRALGKLELLLPPALRRQVGTIGAMTEQLGAAADPVAPDVLVTVARACRDSERLRVTYCDARGVVSERTIDPHRLVRTARRWYLVAWDRDRDAWRTLRIDRLEAVQPTGHRVVLDDPPDAVALVQRAISTAPYRYQARIELDAPLDVLARRIPAATGLLEPVDETTTLLTTGSDDLDALTGHLVALGVGFRVLEPDALRRHLEATVARLQRGYGPPMTASNADVSRATADTEATMAPQSVPVNMYEASGALVLVAPLPAVTAGDVNVEVHPGDPATVRFWAHVRSAGPRQYLLHEWEYGGYERQLDLPSGYGAAIEAALHNGQLVVRLLKGDATESRTINPA